MEPNQNNTNSPTPPIIPVSDNNNPTPNISVPPIEDGNSMPVTPIIPAIDTSTPVPSPTPTIPLPTENITPQPDVQVPPPINPGEEINPTTENSSDTSGKKPKGKMYAAIAGVVLLLLAIPLAIFLVKQNQDIRNKAAGSDAAHCAAADGKRTDSSQLTANCTGWDQNNHSCETDSVNFYYFSACTAVDQGTTAQVTQQKTQTTAGAPDDGNHCAASDGARYSGGKKTNVACDTSSYNSAKNNLCPGASSENPYYYDSCQNTGQNASSSDHCAASDTYRYIQGQKSNIVCSGYDSTNKSCATDQENPYYYASCANTGQNSSDATHCAGSDGVRRAQGKDSGIACQNWVQSNKSCVADQENPYYYTSCASGSGSRTQTATITSADVQPRNGTYGQSLTFTAASTGVGMIHVRIWPNDGPDVKAVDGGKIPNGSGSIPYDTSKLPAGTTTAKVRFQAQDASGNDIGGVAKDIDITLKSASSSLQVTSAAINPNPAVKGSKITFSGALSGAGMIHVRYWANDAPNVKALDGGKLLQTAGAAAGVLNPITFDTSTFPAGTTTALVRFQAQDTNAVDIGGVAKDITLTLIDAPAQGDARCTQMEMVRNNSVIYTSDGGTAPQINPGDQLTFNVYCYTTDTQNDYDYFRIQVTKPDGTIQTSSPDPVATRAQSRDSGNLRFFMASYSLTANSVGNYIIKAWGHTKDAQWKGTR